MGTSLSITDKIPTQRHSCMCTGAANVLGSREHTHSDDPGLEWEFRLHISNHCPGGTLLQVHGHPLRGQSSVYEQHGLISSPKVIFFPKLTN